MKIYRHQSVTGSSKRARDRSWVFNFFSLFFYGRGGEGADVHRLELLLNSENVQ